MRSSSVFATKKTFDNTPTELCQLGYIYGTDKCPQIKHAYTPFYYEFLKDRRNSIKKVLELGIGRLRPNTHVPEKVYEFGIKPYLERGASLKMWRDFFAYAQIFGFDYKPDVMFTEDRIKTFQGDERIQQDLLNLIKFTGSDIDLVIDDASHRTKEQLFTCQILLPIIKKEVIYIIEDCSHTKIIMHMLSQNGDYNFYVPSIYRKWKGGMILVIRNKPYEI